MRATSFTIINKSEISHDYQKHVLRITESYNGKTVLIYLTIERRTEILLTVIGTAISASSELKFKDKLQQVYDWMKSENNNEIILGNRLEKI